MVNIGICQNPYLANKLFSPVEITPKQVTQRFDIQWWLVH